jgi:hypothetical protein
MNRREMLIAIFNNIGNYIKNIESEPIIGWVVSPTLDTIKVGDKRIWFDTTGYGWTFSIDTDDEEELDFSTMSEIEIEEMYGKLFSAIHEYHQEASWELSIIIFRLLSIVNNMSQK